MKQSRSKRVMLVASAAVVVLGEFGCTTKFDDCTSAHTCKTAMAGVGGLPGMGGMGGSGGGQSPGVGGPTDSAGRRSDAGAFDGGGTGGETAGAGDEGGATGNHSRNGAGGAGATGGDGASGEAGAPDTTPPEIVDVVPIDGATGVRADADIAVTFSEAMDESETEHAFQSDDLRPSAIAFSWSEHGRVMTIHPKNGLEYSGDETAPRAYSYSITTIAKDVAGNQLSRPRDFAFTTLSVHTETLAPSDLRQLTEDGTTAQACTVPSGGVTVGDTAENKGVGLLLTFDPTGLGAVPAPDEWTAATLGVSSALGSLSDISAFAVSTDPSMGTWDTALGTDLGTPTSVVGMPFAYSWDVLSAVAVASKSSDSKRLLFQYVLRLAGGSNLDGTAQTFTMTCAGMQLALTYLVP